MKIGLVGMPRTGKTTLFKLLTGLTRDLGGSAGGKLEANIGQLRIVDERLDRLAEVFASRTRVPAEITLVDIALRGGEDHARRADDAEELARLVGDADGFILVLGAFIPPPERVAEELDQTLLSLILSDLGKVERKMERLQKEIGRGQKDKERELRLFERLQDHLEAGQRLATLELEEHEEPLVRGFQFLSLKPMLVVLNVGDDDVHGAAQGSVRERAQQIGLPVEVVAGQVEYELTALADDERQAFQAEYGITESAKDRCVRAAYGTLNLVTFFTAGDNEARAWPAAAGTRAVDAAGKIHTDMAKGFVCAETVSLERLFAAGSFAGAKAHGDVRLEGREYVVQEADMITFRFSR